MTEIPIPSTDGVLLQATVTGDLATAKTIVLFAHGMTGHRDEAYGYFKRLADIFADNSIASVRFDARGHGQTQTPDNVFYTLRGLLDDTQAARSYITTQNAQANVSLFGLGMGGLAALLAPSEGDYDKVIASGPVIDGKDVFFGNPDHIARLRNGEIITVDGLRESIAFYNGIESITPNFISAALQRHQRPVLLIQGEADNVCKPVHARRLATINPQQVTYCSLPGMGHLYPMVDDEDDYERWPRRPDSERNLQTIADTALRFIAA